MPGLSIAPRARLRWLIAVNDVTSMSVKANSSAHRTQRFGPDPSSFDLGRSVDIRESACRHSHFGLCGRRSLRMDAHFRSCASAFHDGDREGAGSAVFARNPVGLARPRFRGWPPGPVSLTGLEGLRLRHTYSTKWGITGARSPATKLAARRFSPAQLGTSDSIDLIRTSAGKVAHHPGRACYDAIRTCAAASSYSVVNIADGAAARCWRTRTSFAPISNDELRSASRVCRASYCLARCRCTSKKVKSPAAGATCAEILLLKRSRYRSSRAGTNSA